MDLSVTVDFSPWIDMIHAIKRNCTPERLFEGAGQLMREDVALQFLESGDPAWVPLSERRFQQRVRKNSGNLAILIDSGSLLTSWVDTASAMNVEYVDSESITIGTTMEKAAILHGGGENEESLMVPARPVRIREDMLQSIAENAVKNLTHLENNG